MSYKDTVSSIKAKLASYRDKATMDSAKAWLNTNQERVGRLFSDAKLRDFVFEPFKGVFSATGDSPESRIKNVITLVAIINMVLAGLPGKLGVGVFVSIAFEAYMAFVIAKEIGLRIYPLSHVWQYFSVLSGSLLTIAFGFKIILGLAYSAFSIIPGINPLIFAELFTTNFVGVMIWVGFKEAQSHGGFKLPMRAMKSIWEQSKELYDYQISAIGDALSISNIKRVGNRFSAWVKGEIPVDQATLRGDLLVTSCLLYLKMGQFEQLQGPIGQEFIGAIKDRYPELEYSSTQEIAEHFSNYDVDQMMGVTSLIKGKLFERLVAKAENSDDDPWYAVLHEDESYPGSDIIFTNEDTGEVLEYSIKASANVFYLEESLSRYPDFPIITVSDHQDQFADDPMYQMFGMSIDELNSVTADNFDALLGQLTTLDVILSTSGGAVIGGVASLWPFTVAFLRNRITQDQLSLAYQKVLGETGIALSARVGYAILLGPLFAWYMLARGIKSGIDIAMPESSPGDPKTSYIVIDLQRQ